MEHEYINTKELAKMLSVSEKFIEKNRNVIAGAVKIGYRWRFNVSEIRRRLVSGRDIVQKRNK